MTSSQLVLLDGRRAVLPEVVLPDPPPTRVYLSGRMYKIAAPTIALPPIINVVKTILNWVGPAGRTAKNIFFLRMAGGTGSTSDSSWLNLVAEGVKTAWATSNINTRVNSVWSLGSVTCKDAGGTSASSTSTSPAIPGTSSGQCLPPQVAVCISWKIAESYRGGKPRTYLPGVPASATVDSGQSQLTDSYCSSLDTAAMLFRTTINALTITGSSLTLGTVSYHTGHAVRPTPLFRVYTDVKVHERCDSQRRRSGPEAVFPVTP